MFKILIFLISALFIENIQSLDNFTNCYKLYCYVWNGKANSYRSLEQCPDGYWKLEIYNEEVQKEVDEFIANILSLKNYYVPLNIKCINKSNCTWKRKNEKAQYFNWGTSDVTSGIGAYYFQASNQGNKWLQMEHLDHICGQVCMTDVQGTGAGTGTDSVKGTDLGMKFYIILLLTSLVITLIILGIIIYFALKKKKSSLRTDVKSFDTPPELDVEASTKDKETSLYAEIENASETFLNHKDSLLQYADVAFCTKISQIASTTSDEQRTIYLGPMGDVYAAVQKP